MGYVEHVVHAERRFGYLSVTYHATNRFVSVCGLLLANNILGDCLRGAVMQDTAYSRQGFGMNEKSNNGIDANGQRVRHARMRIETTRSRGISNIG